MSQGVDGAKRRHKTRRVLVVDDEQALRDVARDVLTEAGYEVLTCSNGREALKALKDESFDAVLSDVRMPDMDGLDLLRAVRERDLDVPVVLWTGGPSVETAAQAVEFGAFQYLIKPVPSERLVDTTARAIKLGTLARLKREALLAMGVDTLVGDRAGLEAAFSRGLATLWTACQPILRAHDGSLYAHEVLLRCDDPLFPTPGALLAVAERLGRLPELGRAVRAAAGAIAATGLGGQLFVNLHPLDLVDPELMDPGGALSPFASRVVLEVTERAPVDSVSGLVERVVDLRSKGYRIALDDFGAGYAGLNSFTTLSPEIVKLDMGLVRGLDRDTVKQKLVSSMAGLCRDLRILVVAEGIETEGEREAAVRSGCDLLQGFLFGRPLRVKSG